MQECLRAPISSSFAAGPPRASIWMTSGINDVDRGSKKLAVRRYGADQLLAIFNIGQIRECWLSATNNTQRDSFRRNLLHIGGSRFPSGQLLSSIITTRRIFSRTTRGGKIETRVSFYSPNEIKKFEFCDFLHVGYIPRTQYSDLGSTRSST